MRVARWLFPLLLLGCAAPVAAKNADEGPKLAELSLDDVEKRLGETGFHMMDCNPRQVFERGHVPGAKWIVYKNLKAEDLPADKEATLVFYCANEH